MFANPRAGASRSGEDQDEIMWATPVRAIQRDRDRGSVACDQATGVVRSKLMCRRFTHDNTKMSIRGGKVKSVALVAADIQFSPEAGTPEP
jgi:hypothetical protein